MKCQRLKGDGLKVTKMAKGGKVCKKESAPKKMSKGGCVTKKKK
jgi:hypothetical protein